jgi:hypothetical protein
MYLKGNRQNQVHGVANVVNVRETCGRHDCAKQQSPVPSHCCTAAFADYRLIDPRGFCTTRAMSDSKAFFLSYASQHVDAARNRRGSSEPPI